MKKGFYTIMAAQFCSSLADNALLVAAIEMLKELHAPPWQIPALTPMFALFYVVLPPFVGAFADAVPKGRAEIIIGKQRNGPTGMVSLAFLGEYTRFENLARGFD